MDTKKSSEAKKPIDRRREAGGSMTVGLPEEGKLTDMVKIGKDGLLMVKEHAIYEVSFADKIDPERKNENIPNVQQRVLSSGSSSELVQRILINSDSLFNETYLRKVDCGLLRVHALNAVMEIASMDRLLNRIIEDEKSQIELIKDAKLENGLIIPNLEDAEQHVKNFMQKTDHFIRELLRITKIFEVNIGNWDGLIKRIKFEGEKSKDQLNFFEKAIKYIKFLRETRNSVEHPNPPSKYVKVNNFRLKSSGEISVPTIVIVHPKFAEPETRLMAFLDATIQSISHLYGDWIAYLCSRHAIFPDFNVAVVKVSSDQRKYEHSSFKYAVQVEGKWLPMG